MDISIILKYQESQNNADHLFYTSGKKEHLIWKRVLILHLELSIAHIATRSKSNNTRHQDQTKLQACWFLIRNLKKFWISLENKLQIEE